MNVDIEKIIENKSLKILFQPIVSIKNKKTIGYEVLSRGINNKEELINAKDLFSAAREKNKLFELDTLCRNMAIERCKELMLEDKHLFLNYDISDLNNGETGKLKLEESLGELAAKLDFLGIKRSNVVIEIVESNVNKMSDLLFFTELCKILGFLIALDDVGTGHSNLNRIPLIKPDIIKIDRYLVKEIQNDYFKQEVYKAITNMAKRTGILVISEGVETKEEALSSIELRADMIQGFYIYKPSEKFNQKADLKIDELHSEFKKYFDKKSNFERSKNIEFLETVNLLKEKLKNFSLNLILFKENSAKYEEIKKFLIESISEYNYIECAYLMDKKGIQISETMFKGENENKHKSSLFSPAEIGEDHSLKQYFFKLHTGQTEAYISDNYISMATGNQCRTVSLYLNEDIVLAVDVDEKEYNNL